MIWTIGIRLPLWGRESDDPGLVSGPPAVGQPGSPASQAGAQLLADHNLPGGAPMDPTTVHVDLNVCGAWEVALSDQREHLTCRTFEEASRLAYRCAADRRPCELIVRDAYHRVLHRELMKVGGESRECALSKPSAPGS
jgi:hypothetical protein